MIVSTNSIQAILTAYKQKLSKIYSIEEATSIFYWCAEEILRRRRHDILIRDLISESELLKFFAALKRLKTGEPVQYVFGKAYFDGLTLSVSPAVLIPRPETEELVQIVANAVTPAMRILDLCTGSGAIALALAHRFPPSTVTATDISVKALEIATKNAQENNITNVTFRREDILKPVHATLFEEDKYDIIVSNPPYVLESEKSLMHRNVLENEPSAALFVPDSDPLKFYRAIAEYAAKYLSAKGQLFLEINENFGTQTAELLRKNGFENVEILKDFKDKFRFAKVVN
ncbi:MAG: peptide chain release factor N(5)-glutamine methyltransferase [Bacteroidales bacterium]|jgi:release factor glutamine methyltransferase|nr:peptide chain release factor N(5)-glutamine methyltransferase [Bacteroidales bacterium]